MIICTFENLERYKGIHTNLDVAIDWFKSKHWEKLPEGKHVISGDNVYVLVQRYVTKSEYMCKMEAHRQYIDIQMLKQGREIIKTASVNDLEVSEPYTSDIEFYTISKNGLFPDIAVHSAFLLPGKCAIFFPEDAHMPCIQADEEGSEVVKIVVKVRI